MKRKLSHISMMARRWGLVASGEWRAVTALVLAVAVPAPSHTARGESRRPRVMPVHCLDLAFACFGPRGNDLLVGGYGDSIRGFVASSGSRGFARRGAYFWGYSFAISHDGAELYLPAPPGVLRSWSLLTQNPVQLPFRVPVACESLALRPSDAVLAVGRYGGVDLWNLKTGQLLVKLDDLPLLHTTCVSFSPDGSYVMGTGQPPPDAGSGQLVVWRVSDGHRVLAEAVDAEMACWISNNEFAVLSGGTVVSRVRDSGRVAWTRPGRDASAVSASAPGGRLAIGTRDGAVEVWEPKQNRRVVRLRGPHTRIIALAVDPAGRCLAGVDADDQVVIWNDLN